jgi:hypothetical protein
MQNDRSFDSKCQNVLSVLTKLQENEYHIASSFVILYVIASICKTFRVIRSVKMMVLTDPIQLKIYATAGLIQLFIQSKTFVLNILEHSTNYQT